MPEPASILIVEDDWIVARAFQKTLENAGYAVTGPATSAREALALTQVKRPDLALVDVVVEGEKDGAALAAHLGAASIPVVYLTAHTDEETLGRAMETEPVGYVFKPFAEGQLLSAVMTGLQRWRAGGARREVVGLEPGAEPQNGGDGPEEREVGERLRRRRLQTVTRLLSQPVSSAGGDQPVLTRRELDVVRLLLDNGRVASIADKLAVSPHTVRNHLRSVFRKLDVHSQVELIRVLTP